jgi:hypothetical protein
MPQRLSYFLCISPTLHEDEISIAYPDLTAYTTLLEAELDCMICIIWFLGEIITPHQYSMH